MPLSDAEIRLIEEGITLAIAAVLAAVKAGNHNGVIDWNSVRIGETPEAALAKAKKKLAPSSKGTETKPQA